VPSHPSLAATSRLNPGGTRCHEQKQSKQLASHLQQAFETTAFPISFTPRDIPFPSASRAGHRHLPVILRDGTHSLAPPPSALPEPHDISLRLHHAPPPPPLHPPTRLVVRLPSAHLPHLVSPTHISQHTLHSHHNVGSRSKVTCQQRQELGARRPWWLH
jgi:hypothetical protein